MGPAIRRAISQALAGMLESVNVMLEHTLSMQGLSWRWEAIRSGKSFAEVVMRHTLLYQVEQVFLVHRDAGLLLQHITAPAIEAPAPDMVAGMLTAINDFARDSFRIGQNDSLETIQLGEFTLAIEQGPRAVLAAVIRGHAPTAFRVDLTAAIEQIEADQTEELASFNGDASQFARSRPRMEALLQAEARTPAREKRQPWRTWLLLGAAAVMLLVFGIPAILRERRWQGALTALRSEPGVVVTHVGRTTGKYRIEGLRDPLARDPLTLFAAAGIDTTLVSAQWSPYVALQPEFIVQRAARSLAAPAGVTLTLAGDTLVATGAAPATWFRQAAALAPALSGVGAWRAAPRDPRELPQLAPLVTRLEAHRVLFATGEWALDSSAGAEVAAITADAARLDSVTATTGYALVLEMVGSADDQGSEAANQMLRGYRAATVGALLAHALPNTPLRINADVPTMALPDSVPEERRARLRAVWPVARFTERP
jgi:OOP family OmpA-OmpF porin